MKNDKESTIVALVVMYILITGIGVVYLSAAFGFAVRVFQVCSGLTF